MTMIRPHRPCWLNGRSEILSLSPCSGDRSLQNWLSCFCVSRVDSASLGFLGIYYELPMPITKLRALLHFRMGSHVLPVEQGRFARPHIPRNLRRCTLCTTGAVGDERHFCFECPFFDGIRAQYADLYDSSGGAMRSFMWHKDQEDVSDCLTAILQLAET